MLGYARVVERAWETLELDGVLFVDNVPTLYLKNVHQSPRSEELNEAHRLFWNQGVAKTLVVADPKTVRIFSSLAKPQERNKAVADSPALVEEMPAPVFAKAETNIFLAHAVGEYYRSHSSHYQEKHCVDQYLLKNLVALRNALTTGAGKLPQDVAHALIGRTLFVCYLVDRGIRPLSEYGAAALREALEMRNDMEAAAFLYDLFATLKEQFNGSMFAQDLQSERAQIMPAHIDLLRKFLAGDEVGSLQGTLRFWAYDFKMIPVEIISAIYEEFLAAEDLAGKRRDGAFYTPRFLVEMTLDVALEGRRDWAGLKYLDPSCGSGIFLVTVFTRLASRWLFDHPDDGDPEHYRLKAEAFREILGRLRGIDKNPTACGLACFSLYLSLLDAMSPTDINTYIAKVSRLPKLLLPQNGVVDANTIPVVREADFLAHDLGEFRPDVIIGNPPWAGRSGKQVALDFLDRADKVLPPEGEGCLLLPSKLFLNNQTEADQKKWLCSHEMKRFVQLADYSFILFENAQCPCVILRYANHPPEDMAASFIYDSPKVTHKYLQRGLVEISSVDRQFLAQGDFLNAAAAGQVSTLWARWKWGTRRDQRLLNCLDTLPKLNALAGGAKSRKRWVKGQGVQPDTEHNCKEPQAPWWPGSMLFLAATTKSLDDNIFIFKCDTESVGDRFTRLYFARDKRVFTPPMVLISQGFTKFCFADFPVLFQDALQSIAGPPEDEALLLFLTVYLRSKLARYIAFMTSANWGVERDKVNFKELLNLPFPLPEDAPAKDAKEIIHHVSGRLREEREALKELASENDPKLPERRKKTRDIQAELEPYIYRYFGLTQPEIDLVEDTTAISIPSSTPGLSPPKILPSLQMVDASDVEGYRDGLAVYGNALATTINRWAAERGGIAKVSPSGGVNGKTGLAVVALKLGERQEPFSRWEFTDEAAQWAKVGLRACVLKSGSILMERELLWFEGDTVYILRPATLRHWTRSAALNDADRLYGEIVMAGREHHA